MEDWSNRSYSPTDGKFLVTPCSPPSCVRLSSTLRRAYEFSVGFLRRMRGYLDAVDTPGRFGAECERQDFVCPLKLFPLATVNDIVVLRPRSKSSGSEARTFRTGVLKLLIIRFSVPPCALTR